MGFVVFAKRFWRRKSAVLGLALLLIVVLMAVAPSLFTQFGPYDQNILNRMQEPGGDHWLGSDNHGRDLWSRVVYGSRISLLVGIVAVSFSAVIGVSLGLFSGFFGGQIDRVIMMAVEIIMAFPMVLMAISVMAVLGQGLTNMMVAIGIAGLPHFTRVVRGQVLSLKTMDFVHAAEAAGAGVGRILFIHILRNSAAAIIVLATMRVATAILTESALSFLGLGVSPPTPTWGVLIADGKRFLQTAPWLSLTPGIAIMITVLAINLFGDGLRDVLDPRMKQR
ncbi:MAG: ABC transporter permease [Thermaerobacterales bacterium]